ncbi:MAG TPA: sigma-54 dependent transcriptional regulator, partial [Oligoflexia bacterium]|nr:sigma-54 dependent transcriptional regulator [Oligoflexia bacterium]
SYIQNVKEMVAAVAKNYTGDHDPVVLIHGESGVGKEVVARYIHRKVFDRDEKNKPFVAINCAAFPDHLLESELFGHEKGAFTGAANRKMGLFELANRGTLFLDEIGEMDIKMQAKMLRVLQERTIRRVGGTADIKVNAHIVTATNRDLSKAVAEGKFREDLFYRLNTIPLTVPPLRSRPEDIPLLADHFLKVLGTNRGKSFTGFSVAAVKAMAQYRWPGNVRELKSVIERALILEKGPVLELSQLRQETLRATMREVASTESVGVVNDNNVHAMGGTGTTPTAGTGSLAPTGPRLYAAVSEKGLANVRKEVDEDLTRDVLVRWLTETQGNVSAISRDLKLDRANLLRLLRRFEIDPDLFRHKKAS